MPRNIESQVESVVMLLENAPQASIYKDDESNDGSLIFEFEGIDGPSLGYIEADGSFTWIVEGGW